MAEQNDGGIDDPTLADQLLPPTRAGPASRSNLKVSSATDSGRVTNNSAITQNPELDCTTSL